MQKSKGEDFAALTQEYSINTASAINGGLLGGWHTVDIFAPEFAQALSSMSKGDISEKAIQTQFG